MGLFKKRKKSSVTETVTEDDLSELEEFVTVVIQDAKDLFNIVEHRPALKVAIIDFIMSNKMNAMTMNIPALLESARNHPLFGPMANRILANVSL